MRKPAGERWSHQLTEGLQVRPLIASPLLLSDFWGLGLAEFQQVTPPHCLCFIYPVSLGPSFADSCAAGSSFTIQLAADPPDNRET